MSVVILASGGLDSTLSSVLAVEEGVEVFPLFVNYGQLAMRKELEACKIVSTQLQLPDPHVVDVAGFGKLYSSGLTDSNRDIFEDAFLPNRNLLFLLLGSTYACSVGASGVSIGLLHEDFSLFPDQTKKFVKDAEQTIRNATGRPIPSFPTVR